MAKLISSDAMFLGGSIFGLMKPGVGKLTFAMMESRPSKRTQAALDELVKAGLVSVEQFNRHGGVTYTNLAEFKRPSAALGKRVGHWPITEPIRTALESKEAGR